MTDAKLLYKAVKLVFVADPMWIYWDLLEKNKLYFQKTGIRISKLQEHIHKSFTLNHSWISFFLRVHHTCTCFKSFKVKYRYSIKTIQLVHKHFSKVGPWSFVWVTCNFLYSIPKSKIAAKMLTNTCSCRISLV